MSYIDKSICVYISSKEKTVTLSCPIFGFMSNIPNGFLHLERGIMRTHCKLSIPCWVLFSDISYNIMILFTVHCYILWDES